MFHAVQYGLSYDIVIEPRTISQVNPDDRFIIPCFGDFDFVDYYGNNPVEIQSMHDGYAELKATGALKYKFGYRSAQTFGKLGNRGCSMYFYNDRGGKGGFAEFENSGMPVGTGENGIHSISTSSTWFFFSDQETIGDVMYSLMGIQCKSE